MYGVTLDNRPKCDAHIADICHKVSALNSEKIFNLVGYRGTVLRL